MKIITTSWDDGSPFDLKLAELLDKYNLPGTLYIPKTNPERPVMPESMIVELSKKFEIGGHTLNHVFLTTVDTGKQQYEITEGYKWLKELLGTAPVSFCAPRGLYNNTIMKIVTDTGFKFIRTTQLFHHSGVINPVRPLMHTTLQCYEHSRFTYLKHQVKWSKYKNLSFWLSNGCEKDLLKLTEQHINAISQRSGCFHLWGHSWEIEAHNLWGKLEQLFKLISNIPEFTYVPNKSAAIYHES